MKLPNEKRPVWAIIKTMIFLRRPPAMVIEQKQSGRKNLTCIPDALSTTQAPEKWNILTSKQLF